MKSQMSRRMLLLCDHYADLRICRVMWFKSQKLSCIGNGEDVVPAMCIRERLSQCVVEVQTVADSSALIECDESSVAANECAHPILHRCFQRAVWDQG